MNYQKRAVGIKGWEMYQCDTNGIVYGQKGRPLKPNVNQKGYKYVVFCKNSKTKTLMVHRIIASTFIPNPTNLPVINHKDGNKLNNNPDNLEWTTFSENTQHAVNVIHTIKSGKENHLSMTVIGRDKKTNEIKYTFDSLGDAAKYFANIKNKKAKSIKAILWQTIHGKRKSYLGCKWEYS